MQFFSELRNQTVLFCRLCARRFPTVHGISHHRTAKELAYSIAPIRHIQEGNELEGFVVQRIEEVTEFNLSAVTLIHKLSGAEYLHIFRNDNNNAFAIGFRTIPSDSTGLPHVLEHTTLCGSIRYPCRDPFFKMTNRSMATFMNALTGPDYTMYPFATQNLQDYNNLMSVYLDAVFNPCLREVDFWQEGWRVEHEDITDLNSSIIFKGVVYNEMKGFFSDPQSVYGQTLLNSILPSNTYGHVSGGDPIKIPCLTYEDLKAFHKRFYNPSNSKFYSYGNFPFSDHLKYINQNYLSRFTDAEHNLQVCVVPPEERWTTPRRKHISCRADPLAADATKQSTVSVSVLLDDIRDLNSAFDWNVLSELLVSGPNSSFSKSLVEPQIGTGFSPATGFESQTRDTIFSVGLQGVSRNDFEKVVNIFDETVDNIIEKGFEQQLIDAVLHGIELNIKNEVTNFGLGLLFGIMPLWIHDGDVIQALRVNDQLASFKQRLKENPRYLQDIVEKKMKRNAHKLILTMSPDEKYEKQLIHEEKCLLESKVKTLSSEDKKKLLVKGQKLFAEQSQLQDASCLPTIRVKDLNKDVELIDLQDISLVSVPVQTSIQPTNGLVYFRGVLNVSSLTDAQKALLPLFAYVATKMGTEKSIFHELDQRINLKTGGITFVPHLKDNLVNQTFHEEGLLFSSYALDHNVEDMFNILSEMFNYLKFDDEKRFVTLVRMDAMSLANSIIDHGHHYSMLSAESFISGSGSYKEMFSGVTYVNEMRRISQLEDMSTILLLLKEMANKLLNKNHLRCAVNYTHSSENKVLNSLERFLVTVPGSVANLSIWSPVPKVKYDHCAVHHVLPIPVNFAAKSLLTVPYTHSDHAPLTILAKLLSSKYLHPTIREKGGAYGSGAVVSISGNFSFFSYRDPNSLTTLDTFDGSQKWINDGKFSEEDLEEAKLGVFQKVDAPVTPENKGLNRFLYGVTDTILQERRRRLMAVTKDDLHEVARRYLSVELKQIRGKALLGPTNPDLKTRCQESWLIKSYD